jgi:single-strand DNA-binding protein
MEEIQMSINITVTGRLTKDPELRKTQSGKLVTSFGLAHNFRERTGNQFKDVITIFFDASVWQEDGAVEVAGLGLTKGTRVTVEGVWSKRSRTTKDGQPRINDVLTVSKIRLLTETEISRPDVAEDGDEPAQDETVPEPAA